MKIATLNDFCSLKDCNKKECLIIVIQEAFFIIFTTQHYVIRLIIVIFLICNKFLKRLVIWKIMNARENYNMGDIQMHTHNLHRLKDKPKPKIQEFSLIWI